MDKYPRLHFSCVFFTVCQTPGVYEKNPHPRTQVEVYGVYIQENVQCSSTESAKASNTSASAALLEAALSCVGSFHIEHISRGTSCSIPRRFAPFASRADLASRYLDSAECVTALKISRHSRSESVSPSPQGRSQAFGRVARAASADLVRISGRVLAGDRRS